MITAASDVRFRVALQAGDYRGARAELFHQMKLASDAISEDGASVAGRRLASGGPMAEAVAEWAALAYRSRKLDEVSGLIDEGSDDDPCGHDPCEVHKPGSPPDARCYLMTEEWFRSPAGEGEREHYLEGHLEDLDLAVLRSRWRL